MMRNGKRRKSTSEAGDKVLAVDVGQSSMRFRSLEGRDILEEWDGPPLRAADEHIPQVVLAVARAIRRMKSPPIQLAIGSSGLDDPWPAARALLSALDPVPERILVVHDSVTAHAGALSGKYGAVTAVGTGAVCLALGPNIVSRVDGRGSLLGDEGSGYWLGRLGLATALKDLDGRRFAPNLRVSAEERFGELTSFASTLSARGDRVSVIASFARDVVGLTSQGDEAATAILRAGAVELAETTIAALSASGSTPNSVVPVSYAGALLDASSDYRRMFQEELAGRCSSIEFRAPEGTPLDGVSRLLELDSGHPLLTGAASVDVSTM